MKEKTEKKTISDLKEESRALRKKSKRVEESRDAIKTKNLKKSKIIKSYMDRQTELEDNRDSWKAKYKESEKARIKSEEALLESKKALQEISARFNLKEDELAQMLAEVRELKKKYPKL